MSVTTETLPKIIWICWFQGREQMPPIVEKCVNSWERKNPDWQITVITQETAGQYIPEINRFLTRQDLSWANKSDILRLYLLDKYGGVWCDATTFCNKPLDQWLSEYLVSGFFAFQRTDRYLLSSWFLAAMPENPLIHAWKLFLDWYWSIHFIRSQTPENNVGGGGVCASTPLGDKLTGWFDRKNLPTSFWFSWLIRGILRISPYFCIHYAFEYLYRRNAQFKQIWDNSPKIHADLPHAVQNYGMFRLDILPELWNDIVSQKCPVYKLSWKFDGSQFTPRCLAGRLLEL